MPPAEPRETAEVAVGRDQLAARLDRDRGDEGIRRQVSLRANCDTEAPVDLPMPLPRSDEHRTGLCQQSVNELEGSLDWRGRREDPGMGGDADEAAQDDLGQP